MEHDIWLDKLEERWAHVFATENRPLSAADLLKEGFEDDKACPLAHDTDFQQKLELAVGELWKGHSLQPVTGLPRAIPRPVASQPEIPGYKITRVIGKGGMGIVFAARDVSSLEREVAIKTVRPESAGDSQLADQFDRESRITAQLSHPGVPPVHAVGKLSDGRPFLVMKLIGGRTLHEELATTDRVASRTRLLGVFEQICQTVGYAHSVGIVHRDLKPLNVMVGAFGEVQVMDWGLARYLATPPGERGRASGADTPDTDATRAGSAKGTPAYMPPEQARGEWDKVDARADVYALGGILCVLLTCKPPYTGADVAAIERKAQAGDLSEAFDRLDGCGADQELVSLCKRCLSPEPEDRPADGKTVADTVTAYREGVEKRTRKAETERAAAEAGGHEQRKRQKVQLALFVSVCLMMLGVGAFAVQHEQAKRKQAESDAAVAKANEEKNQEEAKSNLQKAQSDGEKMVKLAEFNAERKSKADHARERARNLLKLAAEARKDYRYVAAEQNLLEAGELAAKFATDIAPDVEQAKADLAFVRELDAIRMKRSTWIADEGDKGHFDERKVPGQYRAAFLDRKLDVVANPEAVGERVAVAAIRADLVTALDDWAILETDELVRDKVLAAIRRADPDSGARPFRDPTVWKDKAKLQMLVAKADVAQMSPGAVVAIAEVMKRMGLDAAPMLRHAMSLHPRDFLLAFSLGQVLHAKDNKDPEQIGAYRTARAIRPDNFAVLINLGTPLRDSGDLPGAIAAFNQAIRLNPKHAPAHNNLGNALYLKGDVPGAIAAYKEATRLDPNYALAHNNLGVALLNSGDVPGAIAAYKEATRLNPKYALAHYNLGNALRNSGDVPGAIAAHKKATLLDPKYGLSHYSMGNALLNSGDVPGAIAEYKEAIRLDPNYAPVHNNLGNALRNSGDVPGAVTAYKEAIRLNPNYALAHYNLGNALHDSGDLPGAIAEYKEAIRLDPKYAPAHSNLGNALLNSGDVPGAIAAYKKAISSDGKLANAHAMLGVALQQTGDLTGSRVALSEAARLDEKRFGPLLAKLPPVPVAPPPRQKEK